MAIKLTMPKRTLPIKNPTHLKKPAPTETHPNLTQPNPTTHPVIPSLCSFKPIFSLLLQKSEPKFSLLGMISGSGVAAGDGVIMW